jgi:hypothetical protein
MPPDMRRSTPVVAPPDGATGMTSTMPRCLSSSPRASAIAADISWEYCLFLFFVAYDVFDASASSRWVSRPSIPLIGVVELGRHGESLQNAALETEIAVGRSLTVGEQPVKRDRSVKIGGQVVESSCVAGNHVVHAVSRYDGTLVIRPETRALRHVTTEDLRLEQFLQGRRFVKRIPRLALDTGPRA